MDSPLLVSHVSIAQNVANVRIHLDQPSAHRVDRCITGKFCEHLRWNINQGMCAEILRNSTFADYPFTARQFSPDGRLYMLADREVLRNRMQREASDAGWPEQEIDALGEGYFDGLAFWWVREGAREAVKVSPDVGPFGGRAQRVETSGAREGIAQWTALPLHRVRTFSYEITLRSPAASRCTLSVYLQGDELPLAEATFADVRGEWQTFRGMLAVPASAPADGLYKVALTLDAPGAVVIARLLLWPSDHRDGADPEVIDYLRESRLPLLRWPGGNFVSGYRWEDGIGPIEQRPTLPNPAWAGVEPNFFGTDEFMAFCRHVGCEPMICVNAGDGTPAEAARWVEYCNGSRETAMGALRAAHGHAEPYNIRRWEIGNELWGKWQICWTTPMGYADRYRRFAAAMRAVDPTIELFACGAPMWGGEWNEPLIAELGPEIQWFTDHVLVGGPVTADTEPLDVYRDCMGMPEVLGRQWSDLRQSMLAAGIADPRLAITELQLFVREILDAGEGQPVRLTYDNVINPGTLAEAFYDILLYHIAIRQAPFMGVFTHSATVNHGGGLRKERQRVYATPCHYAQTLFAAFHEATPLAVEVTSPVERAPIVLQHLRQAGEAPFDYPIIDALAALAEDGSLLVSIVHRGTGGPLQVAIDLGQFPAAGPATVYTLSAETPLAVNTLAQPRAVYPVTSEMRIEQAALTIEVRPFTLLQVRVPVDESHS